MALATVIAGRYTGTLTPPSGTALSLGVLKDPGYRISFTPAQELINNTDAFGDQVIETIWRGFSQVGVDFTSIEYLSGVLRGANPGATLATTGSTSFQPGLVGRRGTDLAGILILSAVASTPAASSPASATFTTVIIREGFNVEWLLGAQGRSTPIGFRVLPYANGSSLPEYWAAT